MNMDFKSLINKLDSMEAPPSTPKAPELPKAVQLNEDAQLRVLSGFTTYKAEAAKVEEAVKEEMKVGDKKQIATGTVEKTKTGIVHKSNKAYGGSEEKADDKDDEPKAKKAKKESVEEASDKKKAAQEKFKAMIAKKKGDKKEVKEAAKPDFLDIDGDSDKKEPMKKAVADKKKNPFAKKEKTEESVVSELSKDTLKSYKNKNMDSGRSAMIKGDKETLAKRTAGKDAVEKKLSKKVDEVSDATKASYVKKASADVGKMATGEKDGSKMLKRMKGIEKAQESKMMPKGKKRPVKESVENILSFKEMLTLVRESGGQQQIDPLDRELFAWAQRVAVQKLGEGVKADIYAGMTYERMGGKFEMYDVLSEDTK